MLFIKTTCGFVIQAFRLLDYWLGLHFLHLEIRERDNALSLLFLNWYVDLKALLHSLQNRYPASLSSQQPMEPYLFDDRTQDPILSPIPTLSYTHTHTHTHTLHIRISFPANATKQLRPPSWSLHQQTSKHLEPLLRPYLSPQSHQKRKPPTTCTSRENATISARMSEERPLPSSIPKRTPLDTYLLPSLPQPVLPSSGLLPREALLNNSSWEGDRNQLIIAFFKLLAEHSIWELSEVEAFK